VYGVVVGVALFGGGGSDASQVQPASVAPSAPTPSVRSWQSAA